MPRKAESNVSRALLHTISKLPRTWAQKRRAVAGMKGMPDITGLSHGFRIELEGKMPGNRCTLKQKYYLKLFRRCGAITGVYYSTRGGERLLYYQLLKRGIKLPAECFKEIRDEIKRGK